MPVGTYTDINTLPAFLTQLRVDRASLSELRLLLDDVLLPLWRAGNMPEERIIQRACGQNHNRYEALRRALVSRAPVQGFGLLRVMMGAEFKTTVTQSIGAQKAYALYGKEMTAFRDCRCIEDVQSMLLSFTDQGQLFSEANGRPMLRGSDGHEYRSSEVWRMIDAMYKLVGYSIGNVPLNRGEYNTNDPKEWARTMTSGLGLRDVVVGFAVSAQQSSGTSAEHVRRVLSSDIFAHIPEWKEESRQRESGRQEMRIQIPLPPRR